MVRVLQNIGTLASGGMESFLFNLYRHIDREKVQFDFVVGSKNGWNVAYEEEIKQLGGRLYFIPTGLKGFYSFFRLLRAHPEWRVVHSQRDAMSAIYCMIALIGGVKIRIAHSHNAGETGSAKKMFTRLMRPLLHLSSTHRMACGREAGEHLFYGTDYQIVPNAIDLKAYQYDSRKRAEKRNELNIKGNDLLIGHVGRFEQQKNHRFLLDVFSEIYHQRPDAKLLLVGTGSLKEEVKDQARKEGIADSLIILENRSDVNELLQAVDLIIFPSYYEGFSMAMVEMQAAGLRILSSDKVPHEINITGLVHFMSLNQGRKSWAGEALALLPYHRDIEVHEALSREGLDITESARAMQAFYLREHNKHSSKQKKRH